MGRRIKETVECEGRFSNLREYMYNVAMPVVLEDRTIITREDLQEMWDLAQDEIVTGGFDYRDPYHYNSSIDFLRECPNIDYLSLVPLVESHMVLDEGLVNDYALSMGNSERVSAKLEMMSQHPGRFFRTNLRKEPKDVSLPGGKNLSGYRISGNFGIGTISSGGLSGGGIRSDSPFLFEVYQDSARRGEFELAAVVGFWAQNDQMLVSQIQPGRNANFPEGIPFGVGGLRVAECGAYAMGLKDVLTYAAKTHPIFKQYPDSGPAMIREFACVFDGSAKKLGYNGSRGSSYTKHLAGC